VHKALFAPPALPLGTYTMRVLWVALCLTRPMHGFYGLSVDNIGLTGGGRFLGTTRTKPPFQ
jgi:hypothetical protein